MRPDDRELDDEIRGHLALSIQERIDRGEDPDAARRAALGEIGYVPNTRDAMRRVWHSRSLDQAAALGLDLRIALRSLTRAKGLSVAVVVTLALGIGANAAMFSVVRAVLLRPLVNRDADRLLYIRQSAPGIGAENTTFSVPEIEDLEARVTTIAAFGDFSTIDFTMIGFGEPRVVKAGVVGGSFFEVMGLRPVLGRLLNAGDDGPEAKGAAVLTHRFWSTALGSDPAVIGRTLRLGDRTATVVGVLEPSVPYPADTEIIANVVTSPHHLDATMVTGRTHRMTELFGRLRPDATIESARAELEAAHAAMMREHPEAYPASARTRLQATRLREQITAPARMILLLLFAAAGFVFVIACSNVSNLILARSVRREGELSVRAALGAGTGALRRTLLAESLVLCGAGAVLGLLLARPLVTVVSSYAARFSVRALDVSVDASLLWVGAGLAMSAAVLLAYIPRLPSSHAPGGFSLASAGLRISPATRRRLRLFAVTQVALSFVLLVGAGMLIAALVTLQRAPTSFDTRQVLALDVPPKSLGRGGAEVVGFYQEVMRRIGALPGVEAVSVGTFAPWRDAGTFGAGFQFTAEGQTLADGEENPYGRLRIVAPGYFPVLGVPVLSGRDFSDADGRDAEQVVIVSQSVARRLFPDGDALNRRVSWADPVLGSPLPRRIVGVVPDIDDEHVLQGPALNIYHPFAQMGYAGRVFVRSAGDPYALVAPARRIIHELGPDQPVERPATLADIRAEVLSPERLNAFALSAFAGVALLIAVVGVAGVLAFSVSARTREFGVRLAIGSTPRHLLVGVLSEGAVIVVTGIVAGALGGYLLGRVASGYLENLQMPGVWPLMGAAAVLIGAAVAASLMPASRASQVDVLQALRSE